MKYFCEIDTVSKSDWEKIIDQFDDATLYQTWSYGAIRWGEKNISHMLLKKNGIIRAACQVHILLSPANIFSIGYITHGPLCCRKGEKEEKEEKEEIFRNAIEAIYQEYVLKRKMYLRIIPRAFDILDNNLRGILMEAGFKRRDSIIPNKTLLNDTSLSLEDIRSQFHKTWRKNIGRAERNNFKLRDGTGDDLYNMFSDIYNEMYSRKQYKTDIDISEFYEIQKDLPANQKMHIMICMKDDVPAAGLVSSLIGNTAITILGATTDIGLKTYGAYFLRWKLFEQIKNKGLIYLDQGGIDKVKNPGGYTFKSGMGGIETSQLGIYDTCNNLILKNIIQIGEKLLNIKDKFVV
jgi:lipid II:glycine glycyltransferase (peptidoglycan interpeptide bridge formation enzyme)